MAQKLTPPNLHATLLAHVTYESSVRAARIQQIYMRLREGRGTGREEAVKLLAVILKYPKLSLFWWIAAFSVAFSGLLLAEF